MIDKSKLKELAQKATPGEWLHTDRTVYALQHAGWKKGVEQFENRFYCGIQHGRGTPEIELEANAAYIAAANPAAILELLAELEETQATLAQRTEEYEEAHADRLRFACNLLATTTSIEPAEQADSEARNAALRPAPAAIVGGPVAADDKPFYSFWYGHMLGDLMQPPLCGIDHSTARYIWDAATRFRAEGGNTKDDSASSSATPTADVGWLTPDKCLQIELHAAQLTDDWSDSQESSPTEEATSAVFVRAIITEALPLLATKAAQQTAKPVVWMREGATSVMHNFRFDKPNAGPWVALGRVEAPAQSAKQEPSVGELQYKDGNGKYLNTMGWGAKRDGAGMSACVPICHKGEVIALVVSDSANFDLEIEARCKMLTAGNPTQSAEPIGFISHDTLSKLSGPSPYAVDEPAMLWHSDNPPTRAILPVYLAAPSASASPADNQLTLDAVQAALGDSYDPERGLARSVLVLKRAFDAEAKLGETYKKIAFASPAAPVAGSQQVPEVTAAMVAAGEAVAAIHKEADADLGVQAWLSNYEEVFLAMLSAAPAVPVPAEQKPLVPSFECSLASVDAHDPQSFIDGAKWAQDKLSGGAAPSLQQGKEGSQP